MKQAPLDWDYTRLAADYDHRPDYEPLLVRGMLVDCGLGAGDPALDVGAGTGKLTALLCAHGLRVTACEPNAAMRAAGIRKPALARAAWIVARGETLPLAGGSMRAVAYGSSFNVLDPDRALAECARVLRPGGHWLAVWNHRDLADPLQAAVEQAIRRYVPDFDPGRRRITPEMPVRGHASFGNVHAFESRMLVRMETAAWLAAWRSHATLLRQAGDKFPAVLEAIGSLVHGQAELTVPYFTRGWTARREAA